MLCLDSTLSVHSVNTCLYVPCLQAFEPDLALTDLVLVGGSALADLLGIPKAIMFIPGMLSPIVGHSYGSGASLRATVPQWMTLLPRKMVHNSTDVNMTKYQPDVNQTACRSFCMGQCTANSCSEICHADVCPCHQCFAGLANTAALHLCSCICCCTHGLLEYKSTQHTTQLVPTVTVALFCGKSASLDYLTGGQVVDSRQSGLYSRKSTSTKQPQ